jgi:hypothetical protein
LIIPKQQAELLGLRQLKWNLLPKETRISLFRKLCEKGSGYYRMLDSLCFCSNVSGLMKEIGFSHDSDE